jgi:chorismate dehydratase
MDLTLGVIDYLNTQPIEYDIARYLPGVRITRGVPTAINAALLAGEVDVGPMSVYEYARNADQLLVVPGLSIATLGAVNSVNLFSWHADPRELAGCRIALTTHSATSINLLRVLCELHYRVAPQWVPLAPDLEQMLQACDGALLIGDVALREAVTRRHVGRRGLPYLFDLGDEWLKLTGLPFTFAVWVVRRERAEAVREAGIVPALHAAKVEGLRHIEAIAAAYAPRLGLPAGVCAKYLRDLRYDLTGADLKGLRLFLRYACPEFSWGALEWFEAQPGAAHHGTKSQFLVPSS